MLLAERRANTMQRSRRDRMSLALAFGVVANGETLWASSVRTGFRPYGATCGGTRLMHGSR